MVGNSRGIELAETLEGQKPPGPLAPGDEAGDYQITGLLGSGAMGEVYAGTHPVIGKRVAIKVIKQVLAKSEESAQRFIREAKAVNQIDHPNVIDVFAFGRLDDGRLYLVMDLLEGSSLAEHLEAHGGMTHDEVLTIMEPLCSAVDAAHEAGIIHRDLKPANVFLADSKSGDPHVFVLDFGVAKLMSSAQEETGHTLTGQGAWIGTPVYMAPEQWTSEGANPQSDIYALGAMTYELLTGTSPFVADSIPGVMEKHFHAEVPGVKDTGKSTPKHIDDVLRQAMAKDPADRFESAGELFAALQGKRKARVPMARKGGGGIGVAPMALGAALAVAAGGALYVFKTKDDPDTTAAAAQPQDEAGAVGELKVESRPGGATLFANGRELGATPRTLEGEPGESFELTVEKPGYLPESASCKIGDPDMRIELAAVTGFAGRWQTPAGLRQFKRQGDMVYAYKHDPQAGKWIMYREFRFVHSDDGVAFEATAKHIDERAPDEPTCRIPLAARYIYDPGNQSLSLRRQEVKYSFDGGKCLGVRTSWTDPESATRLADVPSDDLTTRISRAGGGNPVNAANIDGAQTDGARAPINPNAGKRNARNQKQKKARQAKKSRANVGNLNPAKSNAAQAKGKPVGQQTDNAPAPQKKVPQRKAAPQRKAPPQKAQTQGKNAPVQKQQLERRK